MLCLPNEHVAYWQCASKARMVMSAICSLPWAISDIPKPRGNRSKNVWTGRVLQVGSERWRDWSCASVSGREQSVCALGHYTYNRTADFLRSTTLNEAELTRNIIGTIGEVDSYQLPDAKGSGYVHCSRRSAQL